MSNIKKTFLSWAENDASALTHNIKVFRQLVGKNVLIAPSVKANAYGHGLSLAAQKVLWAGADWLNVNAMFEAKILRKAGIKAPVYIMGYVLKENLAEALVLDARLVVYNKETVSWLTQASKKTGKKAKIHIKVETGNNRQGVPAQEILAFASWAKKFPEIEIEGIATHFANIEDVHWKSLSNRPGRDTKKSKRQESTPYGFSQYPQEQLRRFQTIIAELENAGIHIPIRHCANSAATMLFPETHFDLVRPGIAVYGLWPSEEVKNAVQAKYPKLKLKPVLSWKTRIAQIKKIRRGESIGYGCTYAAKRDMRIAILPVGYYDGYDRGFSNRAHVLIHGKRANVCGRVCMNIIMVDVTDIPKAKIEDPVTLLGKDGREEISAEYLADLIGTINYEITTRIHEGIPRIIKNL